MIHFTLKNGASQVTKRRGGKLAMSLLVYGLAITNLLAGQKALLVGINEYPDPGSSLQACHNDVALFRSVLENTYGFPPESILEVKDRQATAAGLTRAIKEHLIQGTQEGDVVVFFYAGHGTNVKDLDGDEADGVDEALVTYDFDEQDPKTWFTDDLIFELFSRIPTQQVFAVHDCCHSGTGNRGGLAPSLSATQTSSTRYRFLNSGYLTFDMPETSEYRDSRTVSSVGANPNHVFLGACQDGQVSAEAWVNENLNGLFTSQLCQIMRENPHLSFEELFTKVYESVTRFSTSNPGLRKQEPTIELGSNRGITVEQYLKQDQHLPPQYSQTSSGEGIPVHRIPTLEEITPGYRPSGNIKVSLTMDKPAYYQNEYMNIELMVDSDAWVELYYYGVDDEVYRLFPNQYAKDNFVRGGQTVRIPGDMPFKLRVFLPEDFNEESGNEVIKVVASSQPFSEEESLDNQAEMFSHVDGRLLNPAESRLIEIQSADSREFGEAMLIYGISK